MKLLQQCFLFFISVVILGHNLGNSQVSVYRTTDPTPDGLLYFKVLFIIQHVFSVKGGDTFSSLYKGGENLQLLGRTMGKIR